MFDGSSASSIHGGIQAGGGRAAFKQRPPLSQIAQELEIAGSRLRAWRNKGDSGAVGPSCHGPLGGTGAGRINLTLPPRASSALAFVQEEIAAPIAISAWRGKGARRSNDAAWR